MCKRCARVVFIVYLREGIRYIKALSQLALISLQHRGPSIVRVAGCNNAPTGNAKRELLRSKRLIKMLFRPKIMAFHLIMWDGTPCVKYIRTFRKLSAIYICEV